MKHGPSTRLAAMCLIVAGTATAATYAPTAIISLDSFIADYDTLGAQSLIGGLFVERDGQTVTRPEQSVFISSGVSSETPQSTSASDSSTLMFRNDSNFAFDLNFMVSGMASHRVTDSTPATWADVLNMQSFGRAEFTTSDGTVSSISAALNTPSYSSNGIFGSDATTDTVNETLRFSLMPSDSLSIELTSFASLGPASLSGHNQLADPSSFTTLSPVPLPASAVLLLVGIGAMWGFGRRHAK